MMPVAKETLLLAAVCTADLVLTACLIATGLFTEANPLLAHYLDYGLGAMCMVKFASYALPLAVAEWYRRVQPGFVEPLLRATLWIYGAAYVGSVASVNLPLLFS
jgi:hypothetical protein